MSCTGSGRIVPLPGQDNTNPVSFLFLYFYFYFILIYYFKFSSIFIFSNCSNRIFTVLTPSCTQSKVYPCLLFIKSFDFENLGKIALLFSFIVNRWSITKIWDFINLLMQALVVGVLIENLPLSFSDLRDCWLHKHCFTDVSRMIEFLLCFKISSILLKV